MKYTKVTMRTLSLLLMLALLLCGLPQPARAAGFAAIVTANQMQVYSDSRLTNSAGVLPKDEIVIVEDFSGTVATVTYAGKKGYASILDMERVANYCAKAKVTGVNALAYEEQNLLSRSAALKPGLTVYVVRTDGDWAKIVGGSTVGYTLLKNLTLEENADATGQTAAATTLIPAIVTADSVEVYASPSASGSRLGTLKQGVRVNVVAYTATWAEIELNGHYGYCSVRALGKASDVQPVPTVVPTATNAITGQSIPATAKRDVKVYETPSAEGKSLGTLKQGMEVNVLDYTSKWAHIELSGYQGYCDVSALKPNVTPTPAATATTSAPIPAVVTAASAPVYASASTDSKLLGTLRQGMQVNVVDYNSVWAYIELSGHYGYCGVSALAPSGTATAAPDSTLAPGKNVQFAATVVCPNMPVYASASTSAASTTLPVGTTVNVYAYDNTWAYIGVGTARGYAQVKHLNHNSYGTLSASSSGDAVLAMQRQLEELGYFDGVPGGVYSAVTTEAVKRFQAAVGLNQTGTADEITLRILAGGCAPSSPLLSMTLTKGNTGANVIRLQTRLLSKGYLSKAASVDGDYGSTTTSAVKLFQSKAGLTASGTADSATLRALYSSGAPAMSGGSAADTGATSSETVSSDKTAPKDAGDTPGSNSKIETVISAAKSQMGKPYVYGATGPNSFDCSGLTTYAFKQVGISLNRTAYAQGYNDGTKIEGLSNLVRGDIVCMNTIADNDLCDHVGIYLGGGQMIHASSGKGQVIISSLTSGYYNRVFSWGRRIIQ